MNNRDNDQLVSALARYLRQARWRARRALASARYGPAGLSQAPLIFGNSFPKSGTHLLNQVLLAFPRLGPGVVRGMGPVLTYERRSGRQRTAQEIAADLEPLGAGDISFGHVIALPETHALLCRPDVAHYFLYRDPRDVAVSHAFYVTDKAEDHVHHEFYTRTLPDNEARLRASITGRPELGTAFPDIASRFALYQDWLDCEWVCALRFEDFIEARSQALRTVLAHAIGRGFTCRLPEDQALATLAAAIDPRRSPTFRSGRVGGWRAHFTPELKSLFKELAGGLLIQLGYEQNYDW